jgi:hypothetical protein
MNRISSDYVKTRRGIQPPPRIEEEDPAYRLEGEIGLAHKMVENQDSVLAGLQRRYEQISQGK